MAESRNGQSTFGQNCIKCSTFIQASCNGTTNLINHLKRCNLKTSKLSGQSSVKAMFPSTNAPSRHGLREVAKLLYVDNIPMTEVVKSDTLQSLFPYCGYHDNNYGSLKKELHSEYDMVVKKCFLGERKAINRSSRVGV